MQMSARSQSGPVITSRSNARVKALRAGFSGEARKAGDLLGVEGEHLIMEALRSGVAIEGIYLRAGGEEIFGQPALAALRHMPKFLLTAEVFSSAVNTESPQGIAALVRVPTPSAEEFGSLQGLYLVVEQLQDAGNLGTLLRTAEAFSFARVYATLGTVNEWNPKVVRASAGSVFRMPVKRARVGETAAMLKAGGAKLVAAVARSEDATSLIKARLNKPCAIMVGNEGAGLSQAALALADERVHIPCAVESLNAAVAGTTLMYEAFRQDLLKESSAVAREGAQ